MSQVVPRRAQPPDRLPGHAVDGRLANRPRDLADFEIFQAFNVSGIRDDRQSEQSAKL